MKKFKQLLSLLLVLVMILPMIFISCDLREQTTAGKAESTEITSKNKSEDNNETESKISTGKETVSESGKPTETGKKPSDITETVTEFSILGGDKETVTEAESQTTEEEVSQPDMDRFAKAQMSFAVDLFKETVKQRESDFNQLVSPLSVMLALAMTANGAKGETLEEMEAVLGGLDVDELTVALKSYVDNLPENEKYKLYLANSIWFRDDGDRLTVKEDFLAEGREYFNAEIRKEPFDSGTLNDINSWVEDKTDGMVNNILNEIPENAVMYLINALFFDAQWEYPYEDYQVSDGEFYTLDGSAKLVRMMESYEFRYISDGLAKGFIKNYENEKYAFVALLPNEGTNIYDYIEMLDAERLSQTLSNVRSYTVKAGLPQFSYSYDLEMSPVLSELGIEAAFDDGSADFSDMAVSSRGNISISRVIHKTFIDVSQRGTRAAASTVVEPTDGCIGEYEGAVDLTLNRPFVYMIIECESKQPLFMGTVIDFEDAEVLGSVREAELSYSEVLRCGWYEREEYFEKFGDVILNPDGGAPLIRIDSAEELESFETKLRWSGTVLKNYEGTAEHFFDSNSLFIVYAEMSSGSIVLEVDSAILRDTVTGACLEINLIERCPEAFTEDMAGWLACVGISKAMLNTTDDYLVKFHVGEYIEEKPEYDTSSASIRIDGNGFMQDSFASLIDSVSSGCPIMRIDSMEELSTLTALLSAEEGSFMLDNKQEGVSYNELVTRYDEGYFEKYSLVIIYVTENSGSNSLVLRDSYHHQNKGIKTLNYKIARILPGDGMESTDDMAGWFVCATLNKIYADDDTGYVVEFVNEYYSAWN